MIAVDTNILVYAHRVDSEFHTVAIRRMLELAEGVSQWAIPWPCIHEFLAIVTHARIFNPPTPVAEALKAVRVWIESPFCRLIGEGPGYLDTLDEVLTNSCVIGSAVHDARIAAICMHHGIIKLWTSDRDFSRFGKLVSMNPLVAVEK